MSAQSAPELEPHRCPDCDEVVVAPARYEVGPTVHLARLTNPNHADLVVTRRTGSVILVRDRAPGERPAESDLAVRHVCCPHPFSCPIPAGDGPCGRPARLFATGVWCERHRL